MNQQINFNRRFDVVNEKSIHELESDRKSHASQKPEYDTKSTDYTE
jgi:hypothetical protein